MNALQVTGIVRIIVAMVMAPLIRKGYADDSMTEVIASSLVALGVCAWSLWAHTHAQQIQNVVDIHPEMKVTVPEAVAKDDTKVCEMTKDPAQPQVLLKPGPLIP
jgi:hypothetical protein